MSALAPAAGQQLAKPVPGTSLVAKFASKLGVEANGLLATLKATAFKSQNGVSNEQMMALLIVADQHGLNPFTKEIYAFPDGAGVVPVVGVDGWARIINEHPQFDGMSFSGPDDGSAITCCMHRKDRSHPIEVTEYLEECKRGTGPWKSHPRRMLRHKAMIQCARLAFGFAGIFDPDEAEAIVVAEREAGPRQPRRGEKTTLAELVERVPEGGAAPAVETVDQDTGEIASQPARTYAWFVDEIHGAADGEVASLILDESRSELPPEQQTELAAVWRRKWQP